MAAIDHQPECRCAFCERPDGRSWCVRCKDRPVPKGSHVPCETCRRLDALRSLCPVCREEPPDCICPNQAKIDFVNQQLHDWKYMRQQAQRGDDDDTATV